MVRVNGNAQRLQTGQAQKLLQRVTQDRFTCRQPVLFGRVTAYTRACSGSDDQDVETRVLFFYHKMIYALRFWPELWIVAIPGGVNYDPEKIRYEII